MNRIWWSEFTAEERAELEAWLAEVNRINLEAKPYDPEQEPARSAEAAGSDDSAPF